MKKRIGNERGNLVLVGLRGNAMDDSVKGRKEALAAIAILICIIAVVGAVSSPYISLHWNLFDYTYDIILFWSMLVLMFSALVYLANIIGIEVDSIFEKGISSRRTTLVESLRGGGFVSYESIGLIILGSENTSEGFIETLTIYLRELERPAFRPFANHGYKNDFWERLVQELRTHCRDAKWIDKTSTIS